MVKLSKKAIFAVAAVAAASLTPSVASAQMQRERVVTRTTVTHRDDNQSVSQKRQERRWSYRQGQRLPKTYRSYTAYSGIPSKYRNRIPKTYRDSGRYRYIYRDNAIYVVDPTTQLVRSIIDLLR